MFYKSLRPLTVLYQHNTVALRSSGLQRGGRRMPRLIRRDLRFVLQGQPNVVQTVQKTVPHKFIDREFRAKTLIVTHLALLQVNRELVIANLAGSPHQLSGLSLAQTHRKKSVLRAVVGKNVSEGR